MKSSSHLQRRSTPLRKGGDIIDDNEDVLLQGGCYFAWEGLPEVQSINTAEKTVGQPSLLRSLIKQMALIQTSVYVESRGKKWMKEMLEYSSISREFAGHPCLSDVNNI